MLSSAGAGFRGKFNSGAPESSETRQSAVMSS